MRVKRDFEELYATQTDPWDIGEARGGRYDLYHERLLAAVNGRERILDIGSGLGAFLARFRDNFERLEAIEVSEQALRRARDRYPFIEFHQGSAADLESSHADGRLYDAIIFSDVIGYLREDEKDRALDWIARHLTEDGVALIAAYSPGARYLTSDELRRLVADRFRMVEEQVLDSDHALFVVRRRRWLVALTLDYETWQPIPEGRTIDWERDVLTPTQQLLAICDSIRVPVTLFAEVGEYLWLKENDPAVAERMAQQWRDAARRGHDIQLHLHPSWLPELGARREGNEWHWDWTKHRSADYPGDLASLIRRCREALEEAVRPVDPAYTVRCFRAGAYEAQPFDRLYAALAENGVQADSSVYAGGHRDDRHYDYRLAYSSGQPYFAARRDPQLKAPPSEREIVELPLFSHSWGARLGIDGSDAKLFASRLLEARRRSTVTARELMRERRLARLRTAVSLVYFRALRGRPWVNRLMPRALAHWLTGYAPERLVEDRYFVAIGHSKADLAMDDIQTALNALTPNFDFVTISDMVSAARADLLAGASADAGEEAERQVQREYDTVLGSERNDAQSHPLQELIPLDRRRVLDLGCGAGDWSRRIAALNPWVEVVGIDAGEDFIAYAQSGTTNERVSFRVEDFAALSIPDGDFDCVYADNTLEHAFDVDLTLKEAHRVLRPGGLLVAAIPSDARNPTRVCDNHTWKTAPGDVRARLEEAGFVDVRVEEIDTFRALGTPPFPPSRDRMMYITAWQRDHPASPRERARELATFVYEALEPSSPHRGKELREILAGGTAWCTGYALAAGLMLRREGFQVQWITMTASGPPLVPGGSARDAHEVLQVQYADGSREVLDPMANVWFGAPLEALLRDPRRADVAHVQDERYLARQYELYATSAWYRMVAAVAIRDDPRQVQDFRSVGAWLRSGVPGPSGTLRRNLVLARDFLRSRRHAWAAERT